ncbi:MAG: hypothetical protein QW057_08795 [Candidatus Bathyarchaeia archaeon]
MSLLELQPLGLEELASRYYRRLRYTVRRQVELEGRSGRRHRFDLLLSDSRRSRVAWVKDWNRSVGINMAIALDIAANDVKLLGPIMIAREFSDDVKSYARRRGLTLLTRREILTALSLDHRGPSDTLLKQTTV